MKSKHFFKVAVLNSVLFLTLGFLVAGCASNNSTETNPSVWESRVGSYTYSQAAADYGTPMERLRSGLVELINRQART
jgi:hypothetical protein